MEKFEQHTYLLYVGKAITIFCECTNCTRCSIIGNVFLCNLYLNAVSFTFVYSKAF